jgi:hypothetical protein
VKRTLKLLVFAVMGACIWMLSGQTASAAPRSTASVQPSVQVIVDGVTYFIPLGQEAVIPLENKAPANADPRTIPTAAHFQVASPANGVSPSDVSPSGVSSVAPHTAMAALNPRAAMVALSTNCWNSNGYKEWVSNIYGTTLVSYELDVSYNTDIPANLVTGYNRDYDHWYANGGFGYWWNYNAEQNVNTAVNRESATTDRSIHFTGPYGQTENLEIAIDMHGDCSSGVRPYVYTGENLIHG